MAQITAFGYVAEDLIPKQSQKKQPYVSFLFREPIRNSRWQTYQVWVWGDDVARILRLGVKKGSLVWISGALELVDCTAKQGTEKTRMLKVYCRDFGYLPDRKHSGQRNPKENEPLSQDQLPPPSEIDGDRMALPE